MIGLSGAVWSAYTAYGKTAALGRQSPVAVVSRTQPPNGELSVSPVTAAPAVTRDQPGAVSLTGMALFPYPKGADPVEMAVRGRIQYLTPEEVEQSKSAQEIVEESQCQTCKNRKYQDGSNDPGVSFKTPTNIAPQQAASAVRGHEQEHVVREQAKARREDREIVSQSVTYHTAICPECGRVYISGGTTRTSTRSQSEQPSSADSTTQTPFSAVA